MTNRQKRKNMTMKQPELSEVRSPKLRGGVDKVERYKWKALGSKGEFRWIDKEELEIDHAYQRSKINEKRINQTAANFDWVRCGAISVARRGSKLYVMDGQHRVIAAKKRSDISKLPCMVFDLDSQRDEAKAFVDLNNQKTVVSGVDRFKAMIVAGDPDAIGLMKVIESTGHKVQSYSGTKAVACVQCLTKLYKKNSEMFRQIWLLLADMCPSQPIVDVLARGIWGAELRAQKIGLTLSDHPYRAALIANGGSVLNAEIRREVGIAGKGGERIETAAVIKWINRQRLGNKHKLPLD